MIPFLYLCCLPETLFNLFRPERVLLHECHRLNMICFIIEEHGRGKRNRETNMLTDLDGKTTRSLIMAQALAHMRIVMGLGTMWDHHRRVLLAFGPTLGYRWGMVTLMLLLTTNHGVNRENLIMDTRSALTPDRGPAISKRAMVLFPVNEISATDSWRLWGHTPHLAPSKDRLSIHLAVAHPPHQAVLPVA
jgi:hypothetical protein